MDGVGGEEGMRAAREVEETYLNSEFDTVYSKTSFSRHSK